MKAILPRVFVSPRRSSPVLFLTTTLSQWIASLRSQRRRGERLPMKFTLLLFLALPPLARAATQNDCSHAPDFFKHACHRVQQIWNTGKYELNIPAYDWHNRYFYSNHKNYNENPWGGGLGKSFYDEDGDWHGLYAFAFLDSHKNVEPIAGYGFEKMLHFDDKTAIGIGYTLFLTSRRDIGHSIPFPAALPLVAITHRRATLMFIYVPGGRNVGNVLFVLAKWVLN